MKRIRLVLVADTHLGLDYPVRPRIRRRRRGQDFFDHFEKALAFAREIRADLVVHGGDFFFRSKVPNVVKDMGYRVLLDFAGHGIPFFLVPGNHERSRLPDSLLLSHPGIRIFDRPRTFNLEISGTRIALSGFPFVRENIRSRFQDLLDETGWREQDAHIRLLCLHQAVEGAKVGPSDFTFRHGEDVIPIQSIPDGFTAVLAGHIHRRQVLSKPAPDGTPGVPVIYPGSVERTSFAERFEDKGFYLATFNAEGGNGSRILALDFILLPARPMVDLDLDQEVTVEGLESFLKERIRAMDQDAIVRLRCGDAVDGGVRAALTPVFLRTVFPESMNVQLSASFFLKSRRQ